jgi:hypothetical protein
VDSNHEILSWNQNAHFFADEMLDFFHASILPCPSQNARSFYLFFIA